MLSRTAWFIGVVGFVSRGRLAWKNQLKELIETEGKMIGATKPESEIETPKSLVADPIASADVEGSFVCDWESAHSPLHRNTSMRWWCGLLFLRRSWWEKFYFRCKRDEEIQLNAFPWEVFLDDVTQCRMEYESAVLKSFIKSLMRMLFEQRTEFSYWICWTHYDAELL